MKQAEQHHNQLKKRLNQFEEQFNATAHSTGYETTARENGGIHEEEYNIKNLINAPEGLNIQTGGWFTMDTRGGETQLYCQLTITINGEQLGNPTKAIRSRYHEDQNEWGELRWTTL